VKILFLFQYLGLGGVVRQLSVLTDHLGRRGHHVSLLALYTIDQDWNLLWKLDSPVSPLLRQKPVGVVRAATQLIKAAITLRSLLKKEKIDVLYSFDGDASRFISWLVTRGMADIRLVWGIQGSGRKSALYRDDWKITLPFNLCKWVSGSIPLMIANSQVGCTQRKLAGYRCARQLVINNGFDTDVFKTDSEARTRVRSDWKITHEKLIGIVGRVVVSKGYGNFLQAAASLSTEREDVRFVIIGDGPDRGEVERLSRQSGLTEKLIWAGTRRDMPAVYNALDILCSASDGEGFPNVIGEAMACGVPCVVTNVGDSAKIVGDQGIVVPPGDAQMLANGLRTMLLKLNEIKPLAIRSRIINLFSIENMVDATEKALDEIGCPNSNPRRVAAA
jgi:glycosyltransferase involved in cell wall biosynthesis